MHSRRTKKEVHSEWGISRKTEPEFRASASLAGIFWVDKIVVGFWAPLSSQKQYILLLFGRHRWWLSLLR